MELESDEANCHGFIPWCASAVGSGHLQAEAEEQASMEQESRTRQVNCFVNCSPSQPVRLCLAFRHPPNHCLSCVCACAFSPD